MLPLWVLPWRPGSYSKAVEMSPMPLSAGSPSVSRSYWFLLSLDQHKGQTLLRVEEVPASFYEPCERKPEASVADLIDGRHLNGQNGTAEKV